MKHTILLFLCMASFNSHSTMCGEPEFIDEVVMPSTIFIGHFSSMEYEGEDPAYFKGMSEEVRVSLNPYQILKFDKVSVIKGEPIEQVYIRFSTDGGMNDWFPKPPTVIGGYYAFSFKTDNEKENGSYAKPYRVGPCNMFKRI